MELYPVGLLCGLRCNIIINKSFIPKLLFEKKYRESLTIIQFKEIKDCYEKLTDNEKNCGIFSYYVCCSNDYDIKNCMSWLPCNKDFVEKVFNIIE